MGLFKEEVKEESLVDSVLHHLLDSGVEKMVEAGHARQLIIRGLDNHGVVDYNEIAKKFQVQELHGVVVRFDSVREDGGIRFTW